MINANYKNYGCIIREQNFAEPTNEISSRIEETQLDFYIPIDGTGDKYRIAEISINDNLAYYCVADSLINLDKEIQRKANMHFPGLLNLKSVNIKYLSDYLVNSSVASFIAESAIKNIASKKINDVEIPSYISIPNDADLMPIINIGKDCIKDLKIRERKILAKYEIKTIASKFGNVKKATLKEIDGDIIWEVSTNSGELYFNIINGERIEEIKQTVVI